MKNDAGLYVDLYIPRKCSASHKIIHSKDHGSVQISIADVDAKGVITSEVTTIVLSNDVRRAGDADAAVADLCQKAGIHGEWVSEESQFEGHGMAQSFKIVKKLHDEQTPYQHLQVYETTNWGNLMVLDGVFQNTEVDEFTYHEMQAHVPMFAHPNPTRVLIIGGGDGGVAREILKHESVKELILVDIDEAVTRVSRQFFPKIASALDDPRLTVLHEDGAKFVKQEKYKGYFDVICIDSSDPIGPNAVLFKAPFYRDIYNLLADDGCAIAQGECMWIHPQTIKSVLGMNKEIFDRVDYYWHSIPVYPCGVMGLLSLVKGKNIDMSRIHEKQIEAARKLVESGQTHYYTCEMHSASFVKPAFFSRHETMLRNSTEQD